MSTLSKYNILVVDSDLERRMRLKAASVSAGCFEDVQLCKDARSAIEKLRYDIDRVIVFIGKLDPNTGAAEFIQEARITTGARDSAFIQILDSNTGSKVTNLAASVLDGVDSVLQEPFSVDALLEVTRLASVVYGHRRQSREEGALLQLIKSMLKLLDKVSVAKKLEDGAGSAMRDLREASNSIRNISTNLIPFYINNLIELTEASSVPAELVIYLKKKEDELSGRSERKNRSSLNSNNTDDKKSGTDSVRIIRKR